MKELVIDISHWDGDIDLSAWKRKRGLWGVIIKAGGRETGLGRYKTTTFENQYKKAQAAGLHIGAYYYTVTTDKSNAKLDADHFAGLISGKKFDLPVYMDVEDQRQFGLSRRLLTDIILTFCNTMKGHGYFSGLYTGGSAWLNNMYPEELRQLADWIAWWRKSWPTEAGDIGMWQQGGMRLSDGAIVYADRSGFTDLDWCVVDYPSTIQKSQGKSSKTKTETTTTTVSTTTPAASKPIKGTADAVIKIAEGELGYYAPNDPLAGSKYGRWMAKITGQSWMAGPSKSIWWCCMFVSWVLNQAGVVVKGFPSQNTDVALNGGARNYLVSNKNNIKRGDILIFDWNWNTAATDHIGFAKASPSGGYVSTIEGNVGNAVQNKTRALGTIRYVVRPQYADADTKPAPTQDDTPANNRAGGKLDVDGSIGYNTIVDWQDQLGTPCDGEIWGQVRSNYRFFPSVVERCLTSWDESGSALVKAVQSKVGADADGIWGYKTSRAIQKWLISSGYSCGSSGADGWFGADSAKALQRSLNEGRWK